jgi:hypothetical protein
MPGEKTPEELLQALMAANASTSEGRRLIDNLMLAGSTKVKKELMGMASPFPDARKDKWRSWVDLYIELHHKLRKQNESQSRVSSMSVFLSERLITDQDYLDAIERIKQTGWQTPVEEVGVLLKWAAKQLSRSAVS